MILIGSKKKFQWHVLETKLFVFNLICLFSLYYIMFFILPYRDYIYNRAKILIKASYL